MTWKTTNEVMQAVRDGTECTEDELRYAVHNMALWHAQYMFDIARAITEDPITPKTKRGLQRAWDSWKERNTAPLDKWLKGSSYEPGVPREELHERWLDKTSDTAAKFSEALSALSQASKRYPPLAYTSNTGKRDENGILGSGRSIGRVVHSRLYLPCS